MVSPQAVSNLEFTKALGKIIRRPAVFPLPDVIVKLLFGEMGETLLLGGQKVLPKKLIDSGYKFRYSSLEEALTALIRKP
jgi:NAD dependent epimerase/dehydratase family enzyme